MSKSISLILAVMLTSLISLVSADPKPDRLDRFYGKIQSINLKTNQLTVLNKKRKKQATFTLASNLRVIQKKKVQLKSALKVGQNLIVYYSSNEAGNLAKKITIRTYTPRKAAKKKTL